MVGVEHAGVVGCECAHCGAWVAHFWGDTSHGGMVAWRAHLRHHTRMVVMEMLNCKIQLNNPTKWEWNNSTKQRVDASPH